MTLRAQVLYEFERFRLDPAEQRLLCGDEPVQLTPKAFQILCVLIRSNGRLLNKDELIKEVWPNSFVEEANLSVNISALRRALGDTLDGQKFIETVPKRGYRFVMPVREVGNGSQRELKSEGVSQAAATEQAPTAVVSNLPALPIRRTSLPLLIALVGVAVTVALAAVYLGYFRFHRQRAQAPVTMQVRRLAILPFQNVNRDPGNDFLGFSLADAIIAKLGYVSTLTVRPSSSIQKYRDQTIDPHKVAAELDIDTLLTGTFIREGDKLRVNAQLIDVSTQNIL